MLRRAIVTKFVPFSSCFFTLRAAVSPLLSSSRRHATGSGPSEPETLTIDEVEIVLETETDYVGADAAAGTEFFSQSASSAADDQKKKKKQQDDGNCDGVQSAPSFQDIRTIDAFSRAKVLNFMKKQSSFSPDTHRVTFRRAVEDGSSGGGVFARLPLPVAGFFPASSSSTRAVVAEGCGDDEKGAEACAYMHAERLIDALRIPICSLSSAQARHVTAAKAQGRTAPDHGSQPISAEELARARLPAPVRFLVHGGAASSSSGGNRSSSSSSAAAGYASVFSTPPGFASSPDAVRDPRFVDNGAIARVRSFFAAARVSMNKMSRIVKLNRKDSFAFPDDDDEFGAGLSRQLNMSSSSRRSGGGGGEHDFVAQIRLPVPTDCGPRVALGKASDKHMSFVLACMHAELILDHLGLELFPNDVQRQTLHAAECEGAAAEGGEKRFAPRPGTKHPQRHQLPSPAGLAFRGEAPQAIAAAVAAKFKLQQQKSASGENSNSRQGESSASAASVAADESTQLPPPNVDDLPMWFSPRDAELVLQLLDAFFSQYRATTTQQRQQQQQSEEDEDSSVKRFSIRRIRYGVSFVASVLLPLKQFELHDRVAKGVGFEQQTAKVAACAHALHVLGTLGVPLVWPQSQQQQQQDQDAARRSLRRLGIAVADGTVLVSSAQLNSKPSPPAFRLQFVNTDTDDSNISSSSTKTDSSQDGGGDTNNMMMMMQMDNRRRVKVESMRSMQPREMWSLSPDDDDGYILVHPNAEELRGATHSRSAAVHRKALLSPRRLDPPTRGRVLDYLNRHGVPDDRFCSTMSILNREDRQRYRCHIALPVPGGCGPRTAVGEAPTVREAEVCACMHAELILDRLGVPIFDEPVLQRQHVEFACAQGRMIGVEEETAASSSSATIPSPPPLRKETVDSLAWAKYVRKTEGAAGDVNKVSIRSLSDADLKLFQYLHVEDFTKKNQFLKQRMMTYLRRVSDEIEKKQRQEDGGGAAAGGGGAILLVRELSDIAVSPLPSADPTQSAALYHARFTVPFPEVAEFAFQASERDIAAKAKSKNEDPGAAVAAFRERRRKISLAQGVAEQRGHALQLALLHAERILDALQICVHDNNDKQYIHKQHANMDGRSAPGPHDLPLTGDQLSAVQVPPGLRCDGAAAHFPRPPVAPSSSFSPPAPSSPAFGNNFLDIEEAPSFHSSTSTAASSAAPSSSPATIEEYLARWSNYVGRVNDVLVELRKRRFRRSVGAVAAPRDGNDLVDAAIATAEKAEFHPTAGLDLQTKLKERGLPPLRWKSSSHSVGSGKPVIIASAELAPFPCRVAGVGPNAQTAQVRGEMATLHLLRHIPPSLSASTGGVIFTTPPLSSSATAAARRGGGTGGTHSLRHQHQNQHPAASASQVLSSSSSPQRQVATPAEQAYRTLLLLSAIAGATLSYRTRGNIGSGASTVLAELEGLNPGGGRIVGKSDGCYAGGGKAAVAAATSDLLRVAASGAGSAKLVQLDKVLKSFPVLWRFDVTFVASVVNLGQSTCRAIQERLTSKKLVEDENDGEQQQQQQQQAGEDEADDLDDLLQINNNAQQPHVETPFVAGGERIVNWLESDVAVLPLAPLKQHRIHGRRETGGGGGGGKLLLELSAQIRYEDALPIRSAIQPISDFLRRSLLTTSAAGVKKSNIDETDDLLPVLNILSRRGVNDGVSHLPEIICSALSQQEIASDPRALVVCGSAAAAEVLRQQQKQLHHQQSQNITSSSSSNSSRDNVGSRFVDGGAFSVCCRADFVHWLAVTATRIGPDEVVAMPQVVVFDKVEDGGDAEDGVALLLRGLRELVKRQQEGIAETRCAAVVVSASSLNNNIIKTNEESIVRLQQQQHPSSSTTTTTKRVNTVEELCGAVLEEKRSRKIGEVIIVAVAPDADGVREAVKRISSSISMVGTARLLSCHTFSSAATVVHLFRSINDEQQGSTSSKQQGDTKTTIVVIDAGVYSWMPFDSAVKIVCTAQKMMEPGKMCQLRAELSQCALLGAGGGKGAMAPPGLLDHNLKQGFFAEVDGGAGVSQKQFAVTNFALACLMLNNNNNNGSSIIVDKLLLAGMMLRCFDAALTAGAILHIIASSSNSSHYRDLFPDPRATDDIVAAVAHFRSTCKHEAAQQENGNTNNNKSDNDDTASASSSPSPPPPYRQDLLVKVSATKWQLRQRLVQAGIAPDSGGHKHPGNSAFSDRHPTLSNQSDNAVLLGIALGIAGLTSSPAAPSIFCKSAPSCSETMTKIATRIFNNNIKGKKEDGEEVPMWVSPPRETKDASDSSSNSSSTALTFRFTGMTNLPEPEQQQGTEEADAEKKNYDEISLDEVQEETADAENSSINEDENHAWAAADAQLVAGGDKFNMMGAVEVDSAGVVPGDRQQEKRKKMVAALKRLRKKHEQEQKQEERAKRQLLPYVVSLLQLPQVPQQQQQKRMFNPAVELTATQLLLASAPAAVSLPAEGCDILVVQSACALILGSSSAMAARDAAVSSGAISTLPSLRALHSRLWEVLLHTDYRTFASIPDMGGSADTTSKRKRRHQKKLHHHPLPIEIINVIATVGSKQSNVLNEVGKQVLP